MFTRKTPLQKEWNIMRKKEVRFLNNRMTKKESFLNRQLSDKVPQKLQSTLDQAFEKAFALIFEKGTNVIDKAFRKDRIMDQYQMNEFADSLKQNRKSIHSFAKRAKASKNKNLFLSGAAGISMGVLGVGIPDIPVFVSMMFNSIYEIASSFGYEYESDREKAFILLLIQGAVSYGETVRETEEKVHTFIMEELLPDTLDLQEEIRKTSGLLSKELLYMKFLQGIPVIGAIGGAYDLIYMKQITEYASIKYCRRFLIQKKHIFQKKSELY